MLNRGGSVFKDFFCFLSLLISNFDSEYCAEWMEWNSWADCALEKRVEETDLLLLAEDADLNFEVYTRKRTRDCNIEGACDEAPNLDRKAAKITHCSF